MQSNHIDDPRKLRTGQKLKIPDKEKIPQASADADTHSYIVLRGDTLHSISRREHIPVTTLRELNHLQNNSLQVGQVLILSEKKSASAAAPAPRTVPRAIPVTAPKPVYYFIDSIKHLLDTPKIQPHRWQYIVVHHSGTPSGNARVFDYCHRERGMENGLAYHFVIGNGTDSDDGEIEVGNRWNQQLQGGHLRDEELNKVSLGICLVGNFNNTMPTRKQTAALIELISYLRERCGTPYPKLRMHREINPKPTECPGSRFPLESLKRLFPDDPD